MSPTTVEPDASANPAWVAPLIVSPMVAPVRAVTPSYEPVCVAADVEMVVPASPRVNLDRRRISYEGRCGSWCR